jgi:hypothetical protein
MKSQILSSGIHSTNLPSTKLSTMKAKSYIEDNLRTVSHTEEGRKSIRTGMFMKGISKMESSQDWERTRLPMATSTKETSSIIQCKEEEWSYLPMVTCTKVNWSKTKWKVLAFTKASQRTHSIEGTTRGESKMVKVKYYLTVLSIKEYGRMESFILFEFYLSISLLDSIQLNQSFIIT